MPSDNRSNQQLQAERWSLLRTIDRFTDVPLVVLSFVWLVLLVVDLTRGLSPLLQTLSNTIWILFVLDFAIEVTIAPHKLVYLRRNWLTAVSLLLPALRLLRIVALVRLLRTVQAARSLRLLRVLTTLNRGMRAIGKTLQRRGVGYVIALTGIVTIAGAAGMYAFESPQALVEAGYLDAANAAGGGGLASYGEALWWTAMLMTTLGSDYWPQTVEGRLLTWLLAVYAFAIFGYITATIASFFIGQDAATPEPDAQTAPLAQAVADLREEIAALRAELAADSPAAQPDSQPEPTAPRRPPLER